MSNIYCLRCKAKTGNGQATVVQTKNGKYMVKAKCTKCGGVKNQFVSPNTQAGKGLLSSLGLKLPFLSEIPVLGDLIF